MPSDGEWWRDFFTGHALEFIRSAHDEAQSRAESGFLLRALGLPVGAKILDVPCGGGRISVELASAGYAVTGVDLSRPLLDTARERAEGRGVKIAWEHRDMRDLPWVGQFDGAVCAWSSFGYFDEQGNFDFLKALSNALKPGGKLALDTPLVETRVHEIVSEARVWWRVGGMLALEERDFDHETSRVESDWTFILNGTMEKRHLSLRLYTYRELTGLLEAAGFGEHDAYGGEEFEPFGVGSEWLYIVTTKQ